jgi:hypothetical protein
MLEEALQVGWRPVLAGAATLGIGVAAGWVLASEPHRRPVRAVRWWLSVLLRGVRHRRTTVRALVIFLNNTTVMALLVAMGGLPGGAWAASCAIGTAMGMALRRLDVADLGPAVENPAPPRPGHTFGMILSMLEIPAILLGLGLSLGQLAAPNHLDAAQVWRIFGTILLPTLAVAALGEAVMLGRFHAR